VFTVRGVTNEGREAEVSWYEPGLRAISPAVERGLAGDRELMARALTDEALGYRFSRYTRGPTFVANLDEAKAAVVQLSSYFAPGYRVDGSPPAIDTSVPGGALP